MTKLWLRILVVFLILCTLAPSGKSLAQDGTAAGPVYYVQEGDSLWDIAYRFHVTQDALAAANGIANFNQITIGQPLVIPGLEGIQGVLTTAQVPLGETLHSLSLRYQLSTNTLERLNHLTSPDELYTGYSLVVLQNESPAALGERAVLGENQSLLELSILNDTDPWTILKSNNLDNSTSVLPGDVVRVPGVDDPGPGALPPAITFASATSFTQGQTAVIRIDGANGITLQGSVMDHALNFSTNNNSNYYALQGVHAMAKPGYYPLSLSGKLPDGSSFSFSQEVLVHAGDFVNDLPLSVDPATLDPKTTVPEDTQWYGLASAVTPEKFWQGEFTLPVDPVFASCYPSRFGSRRSYNGSEYKYFHTGLDYCGQIGNSIYATAPGVVVFAGPLTVRGNATMIDHGWGVYSAYMHQSEILVKVGEHVEQGQLIGKVGDTGRVEGPHLHFEILVGDIQVNPVEWLDQEFP